MHGYSFVSSTLYTYTFLTISYCWPNLDAGEEYWSWVPPLHMRHDVHKKLRVYDTHPKASILPYIVVTLHGCLMVLVKTSVDARLFFFEEKLMLDFYPLRIFFTSNVEYG